MNIITEATLYFIIIGIITIGFALFYYNFTSVLNFKWYIDYYNLTDKTCNSGNLSKLEMDRLRYNLYSFLNDLTENEITFSKIQKNFEISFYLFIVYYLIFIIVPFIYMGYLTYVKQLNVSLSSMFGFPLIYLLIAYVWVMYVIYNGVNGSIVTIFNNIKKNISSENSAINKYKKVYKILNALILINNIHDQEMEYVNEKFNENLLTFDEIIEANIASHENLYNTSKIKQIKLHVFEKLDFCKYLVLDTLSHHYLKFFQNIYVRLPNMSTDLYDISENIYLSELYKKDILTPHNYSNIDGIYKQIKSLINTNENGKKSSTYNIMVEKIGSYVPISASQISKRIEDEFRFRNDLNSIMDKDKDLEAYDKKLYDDVKILIGKISPMLRDPIIFKKYNEVNNEIDMKIKMDKDNAFDIENKDYIKYLVENMDIILNADDVTNTDFIDIISLTNELGTYIYAYIVFLFGILMIFAHILFINTNGITHSIFMICIVCVYILYFYYRSMVNSTK